MRIGFPTATLPSGMFFDTTLPAPITTLLPILTLGSIIEPAPIKTSSPIVIFPSFTCFNSFLLMHHVKV